MDIHNAIDRPTRKGPVDYLTGTVWLDPIIEAPAPARVRALRVSFEPGARTAWPTPPLGQTLPVLSGIGRVPAMGGPVRECAPSATVWMAAAQNPTHGPGPGPPPRRGGRPARPAPAGARGFSGGG